jgi:hypothetical protein
MIQSVTVSARAVRGRSGGGQSLVGTAADGKADSEDSDLDLASDSDTLKTEQQQKGSLSEELGWRGVQPACSFCAF